MPSDFIISGSSGAGPYWSGRL